MPHNNHALSSIYSMDELLIAPDKGNGRRHTKNQDACMKAPLLLPQKKLSEAGAAEVGKAIKDIEEYISRWVVLEPIYPLPLALWVTLTHCWYDSGFAPVPYLGITSTMWRSGKSNLMQTLRFACHNSPEPSAPITKRAVLDMIKERGDPTIFIDEAEEYGKNPELVVIMNSGYTTGTVARKMGGESAMFCPKGITLIGDIHNDATRDRTIMVQLVRKQVGEGAEWLHEEVEAEGRALGDSLHDAVLPHLSSIKERYQSYTKEGNPTGDRLLFFSSDRARDIWRPLFALASLFLPHRIEELKAKAMDISMYNTGEPRHFTQLKKEAQFAEAMYFAERLLADVLTICAEHRPPQIAFNIASMHLIHKLLEMPVAPWRRYRGEGGTGITEDDAGAQKLANMLERVGVERRKEPTLRIKPKGEQNSTAKGYPKADLIAAAARMGIPIPAELPRYDLHPRTEQGYRAAERAAWGQVVPRKPRQAKKAGVDPLERC